MLKALKILEALGPLKCDLDHPGALNIALLSMVNAGRRVESPNIYSIYLLFSFKVPEHWLW